MGKNATSNRANQMNPNNSAYWSSRGHLSGTVPAEKASLDNRTNQLNPEHPAYYSSRGTNPPAMQVPRPVRTAEDDTNSKLNQYAPGVSLSPVKKHTSSDYEKTTE